LHDDLNTPMAITRMHALADVGDASGLAAAAAFLGIDLVGEASETVVDVAAVERLVSARLEARNRRDWAESDRLRDLAANLGVRLKDVKDASGMLATEWEPA
jgi:cysteinyl-tRNA synthetase